MRHTTYQRLNARRAYLPCAPALNVAEAADQNQKQSVVQDSNRNENAAQHGNDQGLGRPAVVQLAMVVQALWEVDIRTESYKAVLLVRYRWLCPYEHREQALSKGRDRLDADWAPGWVPYFHILGTTAQLVEEFATYYSETDSSGALWIRGSTRMSVCVTEHYDLHHFPFDLQDINIRLVVDNARVEPLECDIHGNVYMPHTAAWASATAHARTSTALCADANQSMSSFGSATAKGKKGNSKSVCIASSTNSAIEEKQGTASPVQLDQTGTFLQDYSMLQSLPAIYSYQNHELHVVIFLNRAVLYYLANSLFLFFVITTCSLSVWIVPAVNGESTAGRLSLDLTLMLVAVTFKQTVSSLVPPIAYMTLLDAYTITCIGFLGIAVLMHSIVGHCVYEDGTEWDGQEGPYSDHKCSESDRRYYFGFTLAWAVFNALYGMIVIGYRHIDVTHLRAGYRVAAKRHGFRLAQIVRRGAAWQHLDRAERNKTGTYASPLHALLMLFKLMCGGHDHTADWAHVHDEEEAERRERRRRERQRFTFKSDILNRALKRVKLLEMW